MTRHAPGWSWRRDLAGSIDRPWRAQPARVGGLCESAWHGDCPQAPNPLTGAYGTCSCFCHQRIDSPRDLFDLIPGGTA
jgi:hypothetical protein